jgi:alkylated DNA nucleotide flippase Atl1
VRGEVFVAIAEQDAVPLGPSCSTSGQLAPLVGNRRAARFSGWKWGC